MKTAHLPREHPSPLLEKVAWGLVWSIAVPLPAVLIILYLLSR